jgi:aerobic-type carbon monoxide dehydrogenase small subunit (CoxS/CutS family)
VTDAERGVLVGLGETTAISCTVNGRTVEAEIEPRRTLADMLRDDLGLTGTHLGCEHGVCGACTILLDGKATRSCLMLAIQAEGSTITTIEGLADGDELHPVQQAMHERHGFQCSFCAPGFLMTAVAMLERHPEATREEIREELSGNLCRCTGYHTILDGVERAVELMREARR